MKFKEDFRKMLAESEKFPDELIFIGRNMNLVRSINKRCGSIVNRINVMAKYSVKGLQEEYNLMNNEIIKTKSSNKYFLKNFSVFWFNTRLMFSSIIYRFL
jgi:aarF domain-containing kinase